MGRKYEKLLRQMSLEEKALMMSGKNVWETVNFEQYEIPSIVMSDGPHGLRRQAAAGDHLGLNASLPATCFPTAAGIANSWNEQLGEEIGVALAEEAISMGVHVILGPGLNIKRSPLCGRNFEYFSEDPYLAGKMASAYVKGIQSKGIAACPKHFAANSQELRRMANDSVVDERTFRELYTTGFEIAVKEGKAKTIMSSYNEINGVYASENKHMLRDILVDEWGFDGFVVTDWGGSNDHALGVKNGNHLEMPGTGKAGMKDILQGIEKGILTEEELDDRLDEMLQVIFDIAGATGDRKAYDVEAHHALAKKAAQESIVLLKNEAEILPLKKGEKVAIVGDFAQTPRYQGAGSSLVNPSKEPESIMGMLPQYDLSVVGFAQGYIRNKKTDEKLIHEAVDLAKKADTVLVFAGLDEVSESEGLDRVHMKMPKAQEDLIQALLAVHNRVIVVLSAGSAVEMPWHAKVGAIVHGYLGGQAGASAMLDVLTGKYNPSGRLNETYPMKYEDTPNYYYYPGAERSSEYREALYVGYRYYDTVGKDVLYPFGYGLSYTKFAYGNLQILENGVSFTVTNTGDVAGAETPQLYISRESDTVFRPRKELKGFAKVALEPQETKEVFIGFDDKSFRFYDVRTNTWEVESGEYGICIGSNVSDIRLQGTHMVIGTIAEGAYRREELPDYFKGTIQNVGSKQFELLYGREVPDGHWTKEIGMNDAMCQMYYSKSLLLRFACKMLKNMIHRSEKKGKPSLNALFNYNMPIRGYAKMTGGIVNMDMASAITEIANGHRCKGFAHLVKAFFKR